MSKYINSRSIYEHFPNSKIVPDRLTELINWLNISIDDGVGWFPEFRGEFLDWYLPPFDLSTYFGVFANLGDGSLLSYWFYEECDSSNPPIVLLCSDGELCVVARSIEELVARLIDRSFPENSCSTRMANFYLHDNGSWIQKLEQWATEVWGLTNEVKQQLIVLNPEAGYPSLTEWMDSKAIETL
ncbi:hypothetical protein IQ254_21880 [Nodosilinea sp. LEGE 07088]|uniref:hypothetical protein n=1 Tax=Nodosilinea sp. LEGE 07088 TaxID=2777968 RepID=UPI0018829262|nr:hypothetical protein [Nodosilinea sp. LEGE 07088]MBE9139811.1 hypothetical protein [Nodosilinea sp. LEGE 07088]